MAAFFNALLIVLLLGCQTSERAGPRTRRAGDPVGDTVAPRNEIPKGPSDEDESFRRVGFRIIAHRGASLVAPENTIPAFEKALDLRANMVELDYHHSKDGIPVVIHDDTLDRTTNAKDFFKREKVAVNSINAANIQKLDAGSWFNGQFQGTQVPTVDEALDVIQKGATTLIERKGGDAATLAKLLREKGMVEKVFVQAFDWDYLQALRRELPTLRLGALGSGELGPKQLAALEVLRPAAVAWNYKAVSAEFIKKVQGLGAEVWVWTVNDATEAKGLRELGVKGFITDDPAAIAHEVVE